MANSQVCIVSNPYLVSLDCLPNVDFILSDLRKQTQKSGVPSSLKQFRRESNLRRLTRIELSAVLNKNSQTKETRKYRQSESLNAKYYIEKAINEDKKQAEANGVSVDHRKVKSNGVGQTNYITRQDIKKYLIHPVVKKGKQDIDSADKDAM